MEQDTEQFISFVKEKYGLDLASNRGFAERHIASDMIRARVNSVDEYINAIQNNKTIENNMISKIVKSHTYFFRDDFHFEHTRDVLIPYIRRKYSSSVVNIWCCAVSTGEEAYGLAMTLDYFMKDMRFNIFASDLSKNSVDKAQRGIYPSAQLEQIPDAYQKLYCIDNFDGTFSVSDDLKRRINFNVVNLMDTFSFKRRFDAIYCRNVLMYFSGDVRTEVLSRLSSAIRQGGYLYTGVNENISVLSGIPFEYVNSSVYRRT